MKHMQQFTIALALLAAMAALPAAAQQHIKASFERLASSGDVTINNKSDGFQTDDKGRRSSYVVLSFTAQPGSSVVQQALDAMERDKDNAYTSVRQDGDSNDKRSYSIYRDNTNSIVVGKGNVNSWLLCYDDDNDESMRWAYALEWAQGPEGTTTGRTLVTRSPRPGKRQGSIIITQGDGTQRALTLNDLDSLDMDGLDLSQLSEIMPGIMENVGTMLGSLKGLQSLRDLDDDDDLGGDDAADDDKGSSKQSDSKWLMRFDYLCKKFDANATGDRATYCAAALLDHCKQMQGTHMSSAMHSQVAKRLAGLKDKTTDSFAAGIIDECIANVQP